MDNCTAFELVQEAGRKQISTSALKDMSFSGA
jgi:hypothetical protein